MSNLKTLAELAANALQSNPEVVEALKDYDLHLSDGSIALPEHKKAYQTMHILSDFHGTWGSEGIRLEWSNLSPSTTQTQILSNYQKTIEQEIAYLLDLHERVGNFTLDSLHNITPTTHK